MPAQSAPGAHSVSSRPDSAAPRTASVVRTTRAPRRDATANREAIVKAAARALNNDIDAPLEVIAAEAGLTRRAIYGHFASRDELVAEVLSVGARRVAASLTPIGHADARIEIALFGATLWAEVEHVRVTAELAVRGPYREQVGVALEPARARLRSTVQRGVNEKQLRTDIAPEILARLIESAAIAVLNEATQSGLTAVEGHRLVMLNGLAVAGLGWHEAESLITSTPELSYTRTVSQ